MIATAPINQPGIYQMTGEEYHGNNYPAPCLSSGIIKHLLNKSPKHAWTAHPALNPNYCEAQSEAFDIGSAAHSLLLEGIDKATLIEADSWRTNVAKEMRDAARAEGKIPLLLHEYARVIAMVEAAQAQLYKSELRVLDLQDEGVSEQSFVWQEDDVWLKARPDWMAHDDQIILDYKTTSESANPNDLSRILLARGHDIQEALYRRGARILTGQTPQFVFMFQETAEPYLCSFIGLPPQFAEMADWKVERGIALWRECLKSNEWPGYPSRICYLDVPAWAFAQWQNEFQMEQEG